MLHYVIRNARGRFYSWNHNHFFEGLNNATITLKEADAVTLAQHARSSYPEAGVKVSCFRVEFSDV